MSPRLRKSARNVLVRAGGAIATIGGQKVGKRALAFHEVPDAARFGYVLDRLTAEYEVLAIEDWLTVETRDSAAYVQSDMALEPDTPKAVTIRLRPE